MKYALPLASILASLALVATSATSVWADDRPMLRMGSPAAKNATFDPHRATTTNDKIVVSQMYNGLVRFPPGSSDPTKLEPDLAERWESSADGKTWTFFLRKNVKFHGEFGTLTAEDVVYSIKRAADSKRSSFSGPFSIVENVEALDDHTVKITLKHPDPSFLGLVSNYHGGNIISKKAAEKFQEAFGANPIGTGPFKLSEQFTGQHVKLTAHDEYFRGKPRLSGITIRLIPSDSARDLAFRSGELDIIYGKREQQWVDRAKKAEGVTVDVFRPGEYRTVHLNHSIKPLDNLKVRQAIAASINLPEIIKYVGSDIGIPGCSVVPSNYLGEDCSAGTYKYDPEKARSLLKEAGFPDGISLTSIVSNSSTQHPIMEIIQSQLARTGIKVTLDVVDEATYQSRSRANQSAITFYGAARFPDANVWLTEFYDSASTVATPTAMSNFSHCSAGDADIRAARTEVDPEKRLAYWRDAQKKIFDDVCGVPLFSLMQVWARNDKVDYGYSLEGSMNLAPTITENTRLITR